MDKHYKAVAVLKLRHDYYSAGIMPTAKVEPLTGTQSVLRNHRMVFKKKGSSYVLLQEANLTDNQATIPFGPEGILFGFGVQLNDRHFQLRSGLHYDPRRNKLAIELKPGTQQTLSNKDIVPQWKTVPTLSENEIPVKNLDGVVAIDKDLLKQAAFNDLQPGIYTYGENKFLKTDNGPSHDAYIFIILKDNSPAEDTLAVIPAGSYRWRFNIQKKYTQPEDLQLIDENDMVSFSAGENQGSLTTFLSTDTILLKEEVATSLALYNSGNIFKKFLPIPQLEQTRFLSENDKSFVLEAYVTI